ncbi:MAG: glycosyltransferase family 2 protein [Paludibacteraceae bacterium]|nr:glycosyltransferase family 2 protein [Paludibacteraceae bacterium]
MYIPRLTIKILRKIGANRFLFKCLAPFAKARTEINEDIVATAQDRLATLRPVPSGTSMCENNIADNPKYNLQVIIPAYNVEKYIEDCVESVLNQETKYNYIVYIVNDGSTDTTRQILKKYENDSRVILIDQKNKGLSGARNTALKNINADYVTFVDSDDILDEGAIEALLSKAYELDADVVQGNFRRFKTDVKNYTTGSNLSESSETRPNDLMGFAWGKIYRNGLFSHLQFPEGYWYEDTMCNFLILPQCGKTATISKNVYYYRKANKFSITHQTRSNPKCIDSYYITQLVLKEQEQLGIRENDLTDKILNQIRYNTERAVRCLSKTELKYLFVLHCKLFEAYKTEASQNRDYAIIQEALETRRFALLMLFVILC